ncbi:MAG: putative C4-dicarboxylate-binding periplasmic protein precursor [Microvirga sp.]|jgi:tripartite ATP-independent transporter DctP family solute receptor|nr:putative C4-dicarboxylate-binding periplasmic protein precursor [Microvirga sp.]
MMRVKSLLMTVALAVAALAMTGAPATAQAKKVIRINHAGADDIMGTEHQMFSWIFANYVNQKAPTLEVRIFPNSGLGQSRQVIEAMQLGSGASMHIGGMAEFANFCQARCGVVGLPFIFKGYDHVQRVLDGPVGAALSAELEKAGFKALGYMYSWGYRNVVTAKKEIKTVADLKGLKIRTIPTPVFVGAINAMGASATPMNFGEVYTSMQSGVLDGFEHTASTTLSFKFHEIAKYVAITQHLIDPTVVAFSNSEWAKLDGKEQAVVVEGAKLAIDIARAMSSVRETESFAQLKKLGMTITHPDMSEARAKAADVQKEMAAKLKAEDLLQQILAQ